MYTMSEIRPNEVVIDRTNSGYFISPVVDGEQKKMGLIPRDFRSFPRGAHPGVAAVDFQLTDMKDWPDLIKQKEANKSRLSDIRLSGNGGSPIPSLDQDGVGYCWGHSTTGVNMLLRAIANLPYVPLSAFAVCATIKNGRDEGGWGAQSCDFIMQKGQPSQAIWPQGDRNYSKYTNDQNCWNNALQHRIVEGWIDTAVPQYDRDLNRQQVGSLLLADVPVVVDYNWWSHSVYALDLLDLDPSRSATDFMRYGIRIQNSWGDSWSDRGMGVLKGTQAWPDGAVAPRASTISYV